MEYAVISDTHDNFYNLEQAVKIIKERNINECFHLGDFCAPGFVGAMVAHKSISWACVFGNVDGDKAKIIQEQAQEENFDIVPEHFRELDIPSGKVFLAHYPDLARHAAQSGDYVACFYGHNHIKKIERLENNVLLVNPGEITGFKTGWPSLAIWESESNEVELIDLDDFRVTK